jgi:hypothetical protein
MLNCKTISWGFLFFVYSSCLCSEGWPTVYDMYAGAVRNAQWALGGTQGLVMRTRLGFTVSRYYNQYMYGADFTFNRIAGDPLQEDACVDGILLRQDPTGIKAINDGKKTPLFLGGIPDHEMHITRLKDAFPHEVPDARPIGIFTMNEPWECDAAGLTQLIKDHRDQLVQFHYPSPDYAAPAFIDLLRGARDLEHRDEFGHQLAFVHCKAGRGRSATLIAAYLVHTIYKINPVMSLEHVEDYIRSCRPQVKLGEHQKAALQEFYERLQSAGSFENLCRQNQEQIEQRDLEVARTV